MDGGTQDRVTDRDLKRSFHLTKTHDSFAKVSFIQMIELVNFSARLRANLVLNSCAVNVFQYRSYEKPMQYIRNDRLLEQSIDKSTVLFY